MYTILAFLVKNPPPPSYGEDPAWYESVNWNGIILAVVIFVLAFWFVRRLGRRFRRREKDSLELATWAQAGFFKTSRIFRKYGRSYKQGRLSRLAIRLVAGRLNRRQAKYEDDFQHLRTKRMDELDEDSKDEEKP